MKYEGKEGLAMQIICIVDLVLFLANFVMILQNLKRYILRLKIYRPLIVLFYLFVFLSMAFRIVEISFLLHKMQFWPATLVVTTISITALFFMVCVGLVLIVSMHQLSVTISAIQLEISEA